MNGSRRRAASRAAYVAAWAVAGYMAAVIVSFVATSMIWANRVNSVANRGTRDRWAFILGLVGLGLAGLLAWRRVAMEAVDAADAPGADDR